MSEHEVFVFDDAAYVLGGLDPDARAAFEHHLTACAICRHNVDELRSLPPLLQRADLTAWVPESPPDTLLPRLLRQVQRQRRRHRLRAAAAAAVAACLLAVLAVAGLRSWSDATQPQARAFAPVSSSGARVTASVVVTQDHTGTRLRVKCGHYTGGTGAYGSTAGNYQLVVINKAGSRQYLVSWKPGPDVDLSTMSSWPPQAISKIEIEDENQTPVLQVAF